MFIGASGGSVVVDIPNYKSPANGGINTTGAFGTMTIGSVTENGASGGLWNGSGVTSLTLVDSGGVALFTATGSFELYGY
jgi:hypothetical protein